MDIDRNDRIDVAICTWPNHPQRLKYFVRMMDSLKGRLGASQHNIRYLCSAEASRDPMFAWMGKELEQYCDMFHIELQWRDAAPNLGANMNAAIRMCSAPIIFVQQDDWCLDHPLDLSPGAEFMLEHPEVDLLRYCWPDNDRMRPTFMDQPDGYRRIDMRGQWPYGDEPHMQRQDFVAKWGEFFEGGGHASASYALGKKLREGNANIRVAEKNYYHHFGQISSYPRSVEKRDGRRR